MNSFVCLENLDCIGSEFQAGWKMLQVCCLLFGECGMLEGKPKESKRTDKVSWCSFGGIPRSYIQSRLFSAPTNSTWSNLEVNNSLNLYQWQRGSLSLGIGKSKCQGVHPKVWFGKDTYEILQVDWPSHSTRLKVLRCQQKSLIISNSVSKPQKLS